jgi:ABC-type nitrate/sulfonate/bicarbonate transport system substrate-binding protein
MVYRLRSIRWLAALLLGAMVLAACGGDAEQAGGGEGGGKEIIRFAFAPDPVWDYLADTGTLAEWEEEHGLRIVTSESWDEFAYFAGGHGDIVSMGTHELPVLEEETGIKVVAFGKYNHQRVPMYTTPENGYQTLADVPMGSTTCMVSAVSNTIAWSVVADQLHGLNYRVGEGDFDIVIQDHFVMPELVTRGECEVAAAIPEAAIPLLRTGELEIMYDGRGPWQIYQEICECDHEGVMSNLMVSREEWFDEHPDQAAAFLELWQRGIDLWQENKAEIIELYPQHFSVEDEADVEWIIDFMEGPNDWFVDSVYLDEEWIEEEKKFYDYMIEGDWMGEDAPIPRFEAIEPASS